MMKQRLKTICLLTFVAAFVPLFGVNARAATPPITVDNYADAETVNFPVVLLRGSVPEMDDSVVVVENLSTSGSTRISKAISSKGRYKVLVRLSEGLNRLSVASGRTRIDFSLTYLRSVSPRFVRLIYFVDSSDNAEFEIPEDWDVGRDAQSVSSRDFVRRLRVAATLWQTATAERLFDAGYGRRTFNLETDSDGEVVVWKQRGKKTREEYCAESGIECFRDVYREILEGDAYDRNACYFVLTAFRREASEDSDERLAMGVDNMAALDSSGFFSWPERLEDVVDFFSDPVGISEIYSKDSAYRNVRWALTASTLGAGLHELGHAFGLNHTDDPNDFMSRGFDRFNRIFTCIEPPSMISEGGAFNDAEVVEWTSSTAPTLLRSRWIESSTSVQDNVQTN